MNKRFQPAPKPGKKTRTVRVAEDDAEMYLPFGKPEAPERGTRLAKQYMSLVAELPCVCSGRRPVTLHHCRHGRFASRKSSDFDVIPLDHDYHQGKWGVETLPNWWKSEWGLDTDYIKPTRKKVREKIGETIGGEYAELLKKLDQLEREE